MSDARVTFDVQPGRVDISTTKKSTWLLSNLVPGTDRTTSKKLGGVDSTNWLAEAVEFWCSDLIEGAFFGPYETLRPLESSHGAT